MGFWLPWYLGEQNKSLLCLSRLMVCMKFYSVMRVMFGWGMEVSCHHHPLREIPIFVACELWSGKILIRKWKSVALPYIRMLLGMETDIMFWASSSAFCMSLAGVCKVTRHSGQAIRLMWLSVRVMYVCGVEVEWFCDRQFHGSALASAGQQFWDSEYLHGLLFSTSHVATWACMLTEFLNMWRRHPTTNVYKISV